MNSSSPALTAFYDGGCPICRREIALYRRLDRRGRIAWIDITRSPHEVRAHGLEPRDALARMHVRMADGTLVSGARAFVELWRLVPPFTPLAWMAAIPGVVALMDHAYGWFLKRRARRRQAPCDSECG